MLDIMTPSTALQRAKNQIQSLFEAPGPRVFTKRNLAAVLAANRSEWKLPQQLTTPGLEKFLLRETALRRIALESEGYPDITRYVWGDASPFEIALSVRPDAYLSHGTAVFLHGLTNELPKIIYVNKEQSPKPSHDVALSQERIDWAFQRSPRTSSYVLTFDDYRVVLLSGKHTGRLEVGEIEGPQRERLDVTKLERTLIDIAVRPFYAGGPFKMLEAFEMAKDRVSVNTLVAVLKKLDYAYPYHQAIGFLMTRAGYEPDRLQPLRKLPLSFDFYLVHGTKETDYDHEWRLHVPKGL